MLRWWVEQQGARLQPTAATRRQQCRRRCRRRTTRQRSRVCKRENERLYLERDILNKPNRDLCRNTSMRFRSIEDRRADYPVTLRATCSASRRPANAWRSRPESQRSAANGDLVDDIRRVHHDARGVLWQPAYRCGVEGSGPRGGPCQIERLIWRHGIRSMIARPRRMRTTDSRLRLCSTATSSPLLRSRFGFRYHLPRDRSGLTLFGRGHGSVQRQDWPLGDGGSFAHLSMAPLRMVISAPRPGTGLIHHSDRGVQYASAVYRTLMQSTGLKASMSRKVDCCEMLRWRASSRSGRSSSTTSLCNNGIRNGYPCLYRGLL